MAEIRTTLIGSEFIHFSAAEAEQIRAAAELHGVSERQVLMDALAAYPPPA